MNFVVTDDVMSDTLNATVGMFTPATQYFCAITASTSAGPGTVETRNVITCKEIVLCIPYHRLGNFTYNSQLNESDHMLSPQDYIPMFIRIVDTSAC